MAEETPIIALDTVRAMLETCTSGSVLFPPTLLYNEGWLLRLVLDWFSQHDVEGHALRFLKGARWYSEAWLPSAFLARYRGDPLAESWTHADGVIGHFEIGNRGRSDLTLLPDARQLMVLEAKLFSGLSAGVTNAPYFDQAARNVACMAEVLRRAGRHPSGVIQLGFYVLAPRSRIDDGVVARKMNAESVLKKVERRVQGYDGARDAWFSDWFWPAWERIDVAPISWEEIIAEIGKRGAVDGASIRLFYDHCLRFNGSSA